MKTYKGMTRKELIEKIVEARVNQCKKENSVKYGDGFARKNENPETWRNLYKSYPIVSKSCPMFSLSREYETYCVKGA
jgi:hypothetical protein